MSICSNEHCVDVRLASSEGGTMSQWIVQIVHLKGGNNGEQISIVDVEPGEMVEDKYRAVAIRQSLWMKSPRW